MDKPFEPITPGEIQDPDNYKFNWWPDKAKKDDTIKPRYDLLPPEALEEVVKVLTFGATKYSPRGWEVGFPYSRSFGSAMRHLWAWWRGENLDPESGLSHLAHAGCCVLFLLTYQLRANNAKPYRCNGCGNKVEYAKIGLEGYYCNTCTLKKPDSINWTIVGPKDKNKLDDRPGAKA